MLSQANNSYVVKWHFESGIWKIVIISNICHRLLVIISDILCNRHRCSILILTLTCAAFVLSFICLLCPLPLRRNTSYFVPQIHAHPPTQLGKWEESQWNCVLAAAPRPFAFVLSWYLRTRARARRKADTTPPLPLARALKDIRRLSPFSSCCCCRRHHSSSQYGRSKHTQSPQEQPSSIQPAGQLASLFAVRSLSL